jgi:MFS family permease
MKKYLMILTGIFTMMILGTVYSWSVFRVPLESELSLSTLESGLPYMTALFFYAVAMYFSRRLIKANTIRIILLSGSLLVGMGWFLASFVTNPYLLTLVMGVLIGTGVGLMYNIPLTIVPYWFKSHHGLIVGLILLGFGLSPFVSARIASMLIEEFGVFQTFRVLGISYAILLALLSLTFSFPKGMDAKEIHPVNPSEVFKKRSFKQLYVLFLVAVSIGLMMIGLTSNIGNHYVLDSTRITFYITIFAVFNGIGRPIYGALLDKFESKQVILFSFVQILVALTAIIILPFEWMYLVAFSIFWFNLGGWLSIGPNITLNTYGKDVYTSYYGILFTAYGVAALFGNLFAGVILDFFGHPSYLFSSLIVIMVLLIGYTIKFVSLGKEN